MSGCNLSARSNSVRAFELSLFEQWLVASNRGRAAFRVARAASFTLRSNASSALLLCGPRRRTASPLLQVEPLEWSDADATPRCTPARLAASAAAHTTFFASWLGALALRIMIRAVSRVSMGALGKFRPLARPDNNGRSGSLGAFDQGASKVCNCLLICPVSI